MPTTLCCRTGTAPATWGCSWEQQTADPEWLTEAPQTVGPSGDPLDLFGNSFLQDMLLSPQPEAGPCMAPGEVDPFSLPTPEVQPELAPEEDGGFGLMDALEGDEANAALSMAAMVPFAGWSATAGKLGLKGAKAAKGLDRASDAREAAQTLSPRAGRQYEYEVGGKTYSVQHSLTDDVPGHGPHWEAGTIKVEDGVRKYDRVNRPRLWNDKVKVEE